MVKLSGLTFSIKELTMVLTPAQKRANAKYQRNHRAQASLYSMRSTAKRFIRNYASSKDIKELKQLLHDRELQLVDSDKD